MRKNRIYLLLTGIIILGCGIQILFLFVFMNPHALEWSDPQEYLSIANNLLAGKQFGSDIHDLIRSPGYPYFLTGILFLVGNNIMLIRLFHVFLYGFFLLGVFLLGNRWKGQSIGLIMTILCAIYPYFIYIPLTLYPEALLIIITPWVLYFSLRFLQSGISYVLIIICLLLILGILTRPTYFIVSISCITYILYQRN